MALPVTASLMEMRSKPARPRYSIAPPSNSKWTGGHLRGTRRGEERYGRLSRGWVGGWARGPVGAPGVGGKAYQVSIGLKAGVGGPPWKAHNAPAAPAGQFSRAPRGWTVNTVVVGVSSAATRPAAVFKALPRPLPPACRHTSPRLSRLERPKRKMRRHQRQGPRSERGSPTLRFNRVSSRTASPRCPGGSVVWNGW